MKLKELIKALILSLSFKKKIQCPSDLGLKNHYECRKDTVLFGNKEETCHRCWSSVFNNQIEE